MSSEVWLSAAALASAAATLLLCLKIKSSKKDPAFAGLEGTISPLGADGGAKASSSEEGLDATPSPGRPNGTAAGRARTGAAAAAANQTPSRSGERKLPDIPRGFSAANGVEDGSSDLYATLDGGSDEGDGPGPGPGGTSSRSFLGSSSGVNAPPSVKKRNHPYAKVKKKGGVEHPYATVKKAGSANLDGSPGATKVRVEDSSSDEDDEDDEDDRLLLRPEGASRQNSNRSSQHNMDGLVPGGGAHGCSRQTTPLPPEPPQPSNGIGAPVPVIPAPVAAAQHMQNPNMHFSGDSQDSSKGYTSITVREPVRHIKLQRPPLHPNDATYATVSETSDDMYAAIEDPTYVPTGTSQSNSDTYAIIDLPEEAEVDMAPEGGAGAAPAISRPRPMADRPRVPDLSPEHHTYSKVNKVKKRAGPQALPPSAAAAGASLADRSSAQRSLDALGVEDMYAKVQKRGGSGVGSPPGRGAGGQLLMADEDLDLPVGASAMNPSSSTGARPKVRGSLQWTQWAPGGGPSGDKRTRKAEINYSDFEVSHYDKGGGGGGDRLRRPDEEGYETVPEKKDSNGGYEALSEAEWKKKRFQQLQQEQQQRQRLHQNDAGYETVPPRAPPSEESGGGYEFVPDYWRSNNSNGGYETVPDGGMSAAAGSGRREPGYEVVRERRGGRDPGYEKIASRKREEQEEEEDAEIGYETISRDPGNNAKAARNSDYDPGYEVLAGGVKSSSKQGSEPGYETVREKSARDYEVMRGTVSGLLPAPPASASASAAAHSRGRRRPTPEYEMLKTDDEADIPPLPPQTEALAPDSSGPPPVIARQPPLYPPGWRPAPPPSSQDHRQSSPSSIRRTSVVGGEVPAPPHHPPPHQQHQYQQQLHQYHLQHHNHSIAQVFHHPQQQQQEEQQQQQRNSSSSSLLRLGVSDVEAPEEGGKVGGNSSGDDVGAHIYV